MSAPHAFSFGLVSTNGRGLAYVKRSLARLAQGQKVRTLEVEDGDMAVCCSLCGRHVLCARPAAGGAKRPKAPRAQPNIVQQLQAQTAAMRLTANPAVQWIAEGRHNMTPVLHHMALMMPHTGPAPSAAS